MKLAPLLFSRDFSPHPDDAFGLSAIDDKRMRFRLTPSGRVWAANASRRFRDDQIASILQIPRLVDFVTGYPRLDDPPFSDAGIATLCKHPWLQSFGLAYNRNITDNSLRSISMMPRVKWIKVPHCGITDDGVARLAHCPQLLQLSLMGTSVTDASLKTLSQLRKLTHLDISNTKISKGGIEMLASKLPRCRIV